MNLKMFIAQELFHNNDDAVDFIGYYSPSRKWLCLVKSCKPDNLNRLLDNPLGEKSNMLVGQINTNFNSTSVSCSGESFENFISLVVDTGRKRVKKVILNGKCVPEDDIERCLLVEYDMENLMTSLYFKDKTFHNDVTDFLLKSCCSVRNNNLRQDCKYRNCEDKTMFLHVCGFLKAATSSLNRLRILRFQVFEQFCSPPAVLEQFKRKQQDCHILSQQFLSDPQGSCQLKMKNMLVRNIVDVALGLFVMWLFLLTSTENTVMASTSLSELAQRTAQELQVLLNWMMGVPAGLKLNSQLDQFLGKFFLYHIYLWKAYLNVLRPFLPSVFWYTSLSGCLGLSVQLALLQDLLSMMTLHIYCFYVYAARLYNFQMSGLSSLWRLFRGKKWNSLRGRVDSAEYDVNQLFVGTLLFTVLLFLLPTTVLYYVIFLGLRLLVLSIQGSLYVVISVINNSPLYLLLLRVFSSHTVTNTVEFIVSKNKEQIPLCMEMKFKAASYGYLVKEGEMAGMVRTSGSWGQLLKNMLTGRLIYPWIDKLDSTDKS